MARNRIALLMLSPWNCNLCFCRMILLCVASHFYCRIMLDINFSPYPVLETPRLILRQPTLADAPDVFIMRSDPEVMRFIPRPLAQSIADVEALINMINDFAAKNERINWAMEWKETGAVIGFIGYVNLKPEHARGEVGYSLARTWHRKGIMKEALKEVVRYGFEGIGFHSIEAILDVENTPSALLLESVGFRKEALFIEDFLDRGEFRTSAHYGLLRREFSL
jgi:ribosomal-protein-alanine N-acetyltransferase